MKTKFLTTCLAAAALLLTIGVAHLAGPSSPTISKERKDKERPSVLVKFKRGVLSSARAFHSVGEIKSNELKDLFLRFKITSLRAVFENRYHENGKLKPSLAKDNSMHLEDWQRVELESNALAKEFLKQVSRTSALVGVLHQQAKRDCHSWLAVLYLK